MKTSAEYSKAFRDRHPGSAAASMKKYRADHPGADTAAKKKWRDAHIEERRIVEKKWRAEHPIITTAATLLRSVTQRKKNGVAADIDLSDIVIPEFCPVLGIKLDPAAGPHAPNKPSLDRIDPAKGYVKGNVWVISWKANKLKTNNTLETLHALTRALERLY